MSSRFSVAWLLALAPVFLFIPAVVLAGLGPCTFSHPAVMLASLGLFVVLEVAALPCFVRAARTAGKVFLAMVGISLALLLMLLSAVMEFYFVSDYLA